MKLIKDEILPFWRRHPGVSIFLAVLVYCPSADIGGYLFVFGYPKVKWLGAPLLGLTLLICLGCAVCIPVSLYFAYKNFQKRLEIVPSSDPAIWDDKMPKA